MNDIIGIKFFDEIMGEGSVITWGRVFEEKELLIVVASVLKKRFGVTFLHSIEICHSLSEIADQPYFYECLIYFIQAPDIPTEDSRFKVWVKNKRRSLQGGNEILFNGFKIRYYQALDRIRNGISYHQE